MIKGPKKTVSLALPLEKYEELKRLAADNCRTVPSYLRKMIYTYLRRLDIAPPDQDDWWMVK